MRAVSRVPVAAPVEIDRHEMPATGENTGSGRKVTKIDGARITFGDLARFASPRKTAAWLAHVGQCDVRTAEKWLSGQHEPPAEAFGAVMFEIMRRYQMRIGE